MGQAAGLPRDGRPAACPTLAPRLLLLGVVASFLACCVAGRLLSRVNCLRNFTRFHPSINYQNLYYPTVSQVRSLARDTLDPDKVVVVLGGNSILQGFGQGAAGNWTRHLQELLGERFQVLNLALPNTIPFEFGAVAAEVLAPRSPASALAQPLHLARDPGDGRRPRWRAAPELLLLAGAGAGTAGGLPGTRPASALLQRVRDESFREVQRRVSWTPA